ncbi:Fpg/Nei family DNA glycosylase [Rhodococcus sp. BP-349]|uniref:Fpg/Nei family DNA glycosylase n=1 Tax=unclassified Rhodococcus (in: high G+C Gram-positive bacteria) TaxID=192944 RepID=UPI001C9B95BF|nr:MULTISPECIES: DNA-formamidopyrimidine glycosylase family protein [unclassified Rhodococcus (in: high G+C Gram-positive bacteria)]MBY6538275.1 Fpg/Nei family DNA glycosylase [Rhodococcus sp. BP-363]MBY6542612.1 Fpg/Nei family DNA glycosylase [Rhodococcus sp. BP-369]MBY6561842.1 Fpg/Nei family DNA glycosylase [Rhodococcus sp. BP-370]MBY6576134.1 Fpg/Nei family DNA glycosylase [Rhodococcus sp. BP-364]MBY6585435.1 Fpg/Nei family DNA glycosylase [Rhodococcus sp. BP-358]
MPELPEVEALAGFLRDHALGAVIGRIDVAALSVLKTFDPPVTDLQGKDITAAARWGKHLGIEAGGLWLVTHLSRGGWLRWTDNPSSAPPKPGKGPLALRVHLFTPEGLTPAFDLTEAGTRKRLAVWVVRDPQDVPGIARLGPDALAVTEPEFAELLARKSSRLKTALVDQQLLAGIGNAYSDEILHTAKLSPFATTASLTPESVTLLWTTMRSVLLDAVARSEGQDAARLKGEKRSGMRVHARTGMPCPVCGDTVREVSYVDRSFQYCPTCQTGGRILADRRLSRLVK